MKLPVHIAQKLLLLMEGQKLPASSLKHATVNMLLADGILERQLTGRSKWRYFLPDEQKLRAYLKNQFGISKLEVYIETIQKEEIRRADAVEAAADSKLKKIRSFKGFPVNCYQAVKASLNGRPITLLPSEGSFTFIYDFESFVPDEKVTLVGIENPENFRFIEQQKQLFTNIQPLFVSRYPQTKDLARWLTAIPNTYLHFGDFDFAGISLYLNEIKKHIGDRASFFVPEAIEPLIQQYGSRKLYNTQLDLLPSLEKVEEKGLISLISLIHRYKKGLEQEILLKEGLL